MTKESTKDRILDSALELFAERGYDGTGVDLIAEKTGIKGPSLYKHYKGKEAIMDALIDKVESYYTQNFGSSRTPGRIPSSLEELVQMSLARIHFTMHDEQVRKVRKILAKEQFRNEKLAELTTMHHLFSISGMFSAIFKEMMKTGLLREDDPDLLAMEYTAPVSLLIHTYDRQPQKEAEVMVMIEKYIRHFISVYGIEK